ncbi:MAG: N-formylglutamate amidohydrolase [Bacteroidetes bacterium]|nr:N-formylglutamate amidohydrolase [Bacteroidota bacterium]
MKLLNVKHPATDRVPIVISFPHSGTAIPEELKNQYNPDALAHLDDTDWFLPELYSFALDMGITMVEAQLSRWVIDLNRNPESQPLYNDGRLITGLCTTTDFEGNAIYKEGCEPTQEEINRRLKLYYLPYYQKIQVLLNDLKEDFGHALLYDAHSIRSVVTTIQPQRFPDIILGTVDETSAPKNIIEATMNGLKSSDYQVAHNSPFKGGHITRFFGKPEENQYALQVERCKDLYMDKLERAYDAEKGKKMRQMLIQTFSNLINEMK